MEHSTNADFKIPELSRRQLEEAYLNLQAEHEQYKLETMLNVQQLGHALLAVINDNIVVKAEIKPESPFYSLYKTLHDFKASFSYLYERLEESNYSLQKTQINHYNDLFKVKNNLDSIINSFDNAIWLVDKDLKLVEFNAVYAQIYKEYFDVTVNRGDHVFKHTKDLKVVENWKVYFAKAFKGEAVSFEDKLKMGGQKFTTLFKIFPIVEKDQINAVTVYAIDITEQKKQENLLKKQNESLKKANEELDLFAYSVTHDLRAPLTSVLGLIDLMQMQPCEPETRELLKMQQKSVERLDNYITEILHLSRVKRSELVCVPIDWKGVVTSTFEDLSYLSKDLKINQLITMNGTHTPFYSDNNRLLIIINNLVSNAFKYSLRRPTPSFVNLDLKIEAEQATITVSDNGQGVRPESTGRIFEMFYRGTEDNKGSGLGLYIVKQAVSKLNGNISLVSEYGVGSTFTVTIPNAQPEVEISVEP